MELYVIVLAMVVVIAIIARIKHRRKLKRQARLAEREECRASEIREDEAGILAWVELVMSAQTPEGAMHVPSLGQLHHGVDFADNDVRDRYNRAVKRQDAARKTLQFRRADPPTQYQMMVDIRDYAPWDIPFLRPLDDIGPKRRANQIAQAACARVANGERGQAVEDLVSIWRSYQEARKSLYHGAGLEIVLPSDWNDIIAACYMTPSLWMFQGCPDDKSVDQVTHLAAEAIRTHSFVLGKVVMAYCSIDREGGRRCRLAVGDALHAELVKMVESMDSARRDLLQDS